MFRRHQNSRTCSRKVWVPLSYLDTPFSGQETVEETARAGLPRAAAQSFPGTWRRAAEAEPPRHPPRGLPANGSLPPAARPPPPRPAPRLARPPPGGWLRGAQSRAQRRAARAGRAPPRTVETLGFRLPRDRGYGPRESGKDRPGRRGGAAGPRGPRLTLCLSLPAGLGGHLPGAEGAPRLPAGPGTGE